MLIHSIPVHKHLFTILHSVLISLKLNGKIYKAYDSINNRLSVEQFNLEKLIFLTERFKMSPSKYS